MIKNHRDAEIEIRRLQDDLDSTKRLVRTTRSDVESHARILRKTPITQPEVPVVEVPVEPGTGGGTPGLGDFPAGTTNTLMDPVEYDTRGGIKYYRVHSTLNKAANIANFVRYSWWYLLYTDPAASPGSLILPTIEFASIPDRLTLVAVSEWQPMPNAIQYVRTQVYVENSDGLLNTVGAPLSNIATIGANPGLPGGGSEPTGTFISGARVQFAIEYEVKGGVKHYRINGTLDNPTTPGSIANPAGFAEYSWRTALANNSDGSSNYIKEFEFRAVPSISTLTASTDWWILSDTSKYINCVVYIRNADNVLNTTPLSAAYQALTGNPGIAAAPLPDVGSRTVTLDTPTYEIRGTATYFKLKATLSATAGSDTVSYAWYYQQYDSAHAPEYTRVNFANENRLAVLEANTDFWPLADLGRFARVTCLFINKDGVASATGVVSNEVALNPNPGPSYPRATFPTSPATTLSITPEYEKRGDIQHYRITLATSTVANPVGFGEYTWWIRLTNATNTIEITPWTQFGATPAFAGLNTAKTDWWVLADTGVWVQGQCILLNKLGEVGDSLATGLVQLNPNPGILGSDVIDPGTGLAWDTGNQQLIANFWGLKNEDFTSGWKDWSHSTIWILVTGAEAYNGTSVKGVFPSAAYPAEAVTQLVPAEPGKAYRGSWTIKNTVPTMIFDFYSLDKAGAVVDYFSKALPTDNVWQTISISKMLGPNTVNVAVRIVSYGITGPGTCYLDNAHIEQVEVFDDDSVERDYTTDIARIKAQGVSTARLRDLNVAWGKIGIKQIYGQVFGLAGIDDVQYFKGGVISSNAVFSGAVIQTGNIVTLNCDKLNAGDITGCSLTLGLGLHTVVVKPISDPTYGAIAGVKVYETAKSFQRSLVTSGGFAAFNANNYKCFEAYADNSVSYPGGYLGVYNNVGSAPCSINGINGQITAYTGFYVKGGSGILYASLYNNGNSGGVVQLYNTNGGSISIELNGTNGKIKLTTLETFTGANLVINNHLTVNGQIATTGIVASGNYQANGLQLLAASRQSGVGSPGADVNSLKTAVDAIINRLQLHGLIS